jgi:hypothetical protein
MRTVIKNVVIGLVIFLTLTTNVSATPTNVANMLPAAELKMIGRLNNQPVFQLSLNNTANERFVVIVKDETGSILYQENISGVNIKRNYQLNTEELGYVGITFEIINTKESKPVVFTIENSTRIVTETFVVKSK